ncbi:M23 family metallopeptidase [Halorussus halophilus]|uniref:M23 family metallopeptidase n=1 Tax=Halorussus halophilus TaxID=2650975 RepID=UPI00130159C3|nr:M23 family metallopeptidase [Halorussus halophilus]
MKDGDVQDCGWTMRDRSTGRKTQEFSRRKLLKAVGASSGLAVGTGVTSARSRGSSEAVAEADTLAQDTCPPDLTGRWETEDGNEWTLDHIGSTVYGYTMGDAECDGDNGWVPTGDQESPDLVMEATFTDDTLTGTQEICYTSTDEDWPCYGQVIWEDFELTVSEDGHTLSGYWVDSCNEIEVSDSLTRCGGDNQHDPLDDMSTLQSPGPSGWRGAIFGCYRSGCKVRHRGWDIHAPVGTPVKAAVSGRITHRTQENKETGEKTGFGDYIVLRDSGSRNSFIYAHLGTRKPEDYYCAGEEIGTVGISGNANAARPHLHIEIGYRRTRLDPNEFFELPSQVVEQVGSAPKYIQLPDQWNCVPCEMNQALLDLEC